MKRFPSGRWRSVSLSLLAFLVSGGMIVLSVDLVEEHAQLIGDVSRSALPVAAEIPMLEERRDMLERQLDLTRLASTARDGSLRERLKVFVLAARPVDRTIASLTVLIDGLRARGELLDVSPIEVLESTEEGEVFGASFVVDEAGFQTLHHFIGLSGLLTIADALTPQQIDTLLEITERENPTGVVALSQFLATDLGKYLRDPASYDHRLLGEFTSDDFSAAFADILGSEIFERGGAIARGNIGQSLFAQNLWPLPFLSIRNIAVEDHSAGWQRVTVELVAHTADAVVP